MDLKQTHVVRVAQRVLWEQQLALWLKWIVACEGLKRTQIELFSADRVRDDGYFE